MNVALLTAVAITLVLIVIWAFPVVALLKQKYVLFVVGLAFVAGGVLAFGLEPLTTGAVAGVGLVVWIVAAVRLAPPASRWAKQLYGEAKAARARERPAGAATRAWEKKHRIAAPTSAATVGPRALSAAAAVVELGFVVVGAVGVVAGGIASGAALPVLWLVRAGWRRGRTIVTVLAVLAAANTVYNLTSGGAAPLPFWIVFAAGVLLLAGGQVFLYRNPTAAYLADATR